MGTGSSLGESAVRVTGSAASSRSNRLMDPSPAPLQIPASIHETMVAHCLREDPLECCGLLGGVPPLVSSIHPLRNADASEVHYNADSRDLIDAVVRLRERGARILAIYHSHPRSRPIPSQADLRENYYGDVARIIISLLAEPPEVRIWRLDPSSYEELPWQIVGDSSGPPAPH